MVLIKLYIAKPKTGISIRQSIIYPKVIFIFITNKCIIMKQIIIIKNAISKNNKVFIDIFFSFLKNSTELHIK